MQILRTPDDHLDPSPTESHMACLRFPPASWSSHRLGLPLKQFFRDFWIWVIFLFALFLFQAFFTPGPRLSFFPQLPVSQDGVRLGGFTCWRLAVILGYAVLFTAITVLAKFKTHSSGS